MIKTNSKTRKMAYIALMAILICVCSWITIPMAVPFTMQTFAVFFALIFLGGKFGTFAIGIYIVMGAIGIPVFSGFQGGLGHILGPTGGYIIGFLLSGVVYILFEKVTRSDAFKWISLVISLIICYAAGTLWYIIVCGSYGNSYSLLAALGLCVFPYIIPDILKILLAYYLSSRLKKVVWSY